MIKGNKDKVIVIICIIAFAALGFYKSNKSNYIKNEENLHIVNADETNQAETTSEIYVHIDGEVNKPGVYKVDQSHRIDDVLTMAGGITELADLTSINLAKKVEDEMKIYIPSTQEAIQNTPVDVNLSNDNVNDKVNINTADKDMLKTLPGIGDTRADEIIRYRETNRFTKIEDIQNISGIGEKTYEKLKDMITI